MTMGNPLHRTRDRIAAAALAFLAGCGAGALAAPCDTAHLADFARVKSEHAARRYDLALNDAKALQRADPDNLRARYAMGLAEVEAGATLQGAARTQMAAAGLSDLDAAASGVDAYAERGDPAVRQCLKDQDVFSVMNTVGYYYLKGGALAEAEKYLTRAAQLDRLGLLSPDTRRKVYANLGLLYFKTGNYANAQKFLGQAQSAGSTSPSVSSTMTAIIKIQSISATAPH